MATYNVIVKEEKDWDDLMESFPKGEVDEKFSKLDWNIKVPHEDEDRLNEYCEDKSFECEFVD